MSSYLSNDQLFQAARILIKNRRIQPRHNNDCLEPIIRAFDQNLLNALNILCQTTTFYVRPGNGLLNLANFNAVVGHPYPSSVADAVFILHQAGLLRSYNAQANFNAIAGHRDPRLFARALDEIHQQGLLQGDYAQAVRNAVTGHDEPFSVASALSRLSEAGLLQDDDNAEAIFNAVTRHKEPFSVACGILTLHEAGLLQGDEANLNAVTRSSSPTDAANGLKQLNEAGLLQGNHAQANRNTIAEHVNSRGITAALKRLCETGLLQEDNAQVNFNKVAAHNDPFGIALALGKLEQANLLQGDHARANFNVLTAHHDPCNISNALATLNQAGLLQNNNAQANFNELAAHSDPCAVAHALNILRQLGLLEGNNAHANFNAVLNHDNLRGITLALEKLKMTETLKSQHTQHRFDQIRGMQFPIHNRFAQALTLLPYFSTESFAFDELTRAPRQAMNIVTSFFSNQTQLMTYNSRKTVRSYCKLDRFISTLAQLGRQKALPTEICVHIGTFVFGDETETKAIAMDELTKVKRPCEQNIHNNQVSLPQPITPLDHFDNQQQLITTMRLYIQIKAAVIHIEQKTDYITNWPDQIKQAVQAIIETPGSLMPNKAYCETLKSLKSALEALHPPQKDYRPNDVATQTPVQSQIMDTFTNIEAIDQQRGLQSASSLYDDCDRLLRQSGFFQFVHPRSDDNSDQKQPKPSY